MATNLDTTTENPVRAALDRLKVDGYGEDGFDTAGARDGYQRPLVKDPSDLTGKPTPMQRPSTRAKALDEPGGLIRWKAGMAALGAALDPERTSRLLALDLDNPKHRSYLYAEADELAELAGSKEGAEYGSLVHALLQAWIAGADWKSYLAGLDDIEDMMIRAVESAQREIAANGIEVLESEVCCVNEDHGTAGSTDGIGRRNGRSRIFDFKTTKPTSLRQSWASFLVQCRLYSRSSCLYDPDTGHRRPFPDDFDTDHAWIIHVDWRQGRTTIYDLDLTQVDAAIELANQVFEWRQSAGRYVTTLRPDDLEATLEQSLHLVQANEAAQAEAEANWNQLANQVNERAEAERVTDLAPPSAPKAPPPRSVTVPQARNGGREDLLDHTRARMAELVEAGYGELLRRLWTEQGLPGIGPSSPPVDASTLQAIGLVLTEVEREVHRYVEDDEIDEFKAAYAGLDDAKARKFSDWMLSTGWNPGHRLTRNRANAVIEVLLELSLS